MICLLYNLFKRFIFCVCFFPNSTKLCVFLLIELQLAIKLNHLEMVKKLLPQCKLDHLDINNNSIYHYAAPTTKEIINVSIVKHLPFITTTQSICNIFNDKPIHINCNSICWTILCFVLHCSISFCVRCDDDDDDNAVTVALSSLNDSKTFNGIRCVAIYSISTTSSC